VVDPNLNVSWREILLMDLDLLGHFKYSFNRYLYFFLLQIGGQKSA